MSIDVATVSISSANPADRIAAGVVDAVKVYGRGSTEVRALDGVTIDFAAGQWTAIMGPSGSGKSTLPLLVIGVGAVIGGLLAAFRPARRAARLDVLSAIAAG